MPYEICERPWEFQTEPFQIAGNLYYVGNTDVSCHLIDTGQGLILLDTGFPQTVYLLLESIYRLGFRPADLKYIIHSHGHYDHFGGTRALVELTGAKTAMGLADLEILTEKPELSWAPEYGTTFYETFDVDTPLVDGQLISMGETTIECMHTPGHTPGTFSYFFEIAVDGQRYVAGIHGGPGLNTLELDYLNQYKLPLTRRTDFLDSLKRLKERNVDIFIAAHPNQNNTFRKQADLEGKTNPFIDSNAWLGFLNQLETEALAEFNTEDP